MRRKERVLALYRQVRDIAIPLRAAYAGYFIILSVFPALLLLLTMIRFTGIRVESLIELLEGLLPQAFHEYAEELVFGAWQNATGTVVGISAVTALWSASRGIYGLHAGLNAVCGVSESRGYVLTRLLCALYALVFLLVVLLTLALHVFGSALMEMLLKIDHPVIIFLTDVLNSRFFLLGILQTLVFTLMYRFLPNRKSTFLRCLPGGLFASVGWLVFSDLYSVYIAHFSAYANIYGSIYAVALCMLWLYFCMSILFYGGVLNRLLEKRL